MSQDILSTYCHHENCMLTWEWMITCYRATEDHGVKQDFATQGSSQMRHNASAIAESISRMESDIQKFSIAYDEEWIESWDFVICEILIDALYHNENLQKVSEDNARALARIVDENPDIATQILAVAEHEAKRGVAQ